MALQPFLDHACGLVTEGPLDRAALFAAIGSLAADRLPGIPAGAIAAALESRELSGATGTREGVAFPHAILEDSPQIIVVPAVVRRGVELTRQAGSVRLILCTVGSRKDPGEHLRVLARLSRCVLRPESRGELLAATDAADLVQRLLREDGMHG